MRDGWRREGIIPGAVIHVCHSLSVSIITITSYITTNHTNINIYTTAFFLLCTLFFYSLVYLHLTQSRGSSLSILFFDDASDLRVFPNSIFSLLHTKEDHDSLQSLISPWHRQNLQPKLLAMVSSLSPLERLQTTSFPGKCRPERKKETPPD